MSTFVPRNVRINWGGEVCLGIDLCVRTEIKWILLFQGASKHFLFDSRWTGGLQQHTCGPDHLQSLTINSRLFQGYWTPSQDLFQASHINTITTKSVLMSVFVATITRKCLNTASTARVQFCRTLLDLKVTIWTPKQPHRFIYVLCSFWKGQFLSSACEGTNAERTKCQGYKRLTYKYKPSFTSWQWISGSAAANTSRKAI